MLEAVNGVPVAVQHGAEGAVKGEPRCGGSGGTEAEPPTLLRPQIPKTRFCFNTSYDP